MSIEPERDQYFQYATFGVIGLTLVICACYGLLFLNPAVNPVRGLQPPTSTRQVAVVEFPATWTPTATRTPTNTPTEPPTNTPTDTPTNTPLATNTRLPTATFTPRPATPRPPTVRPVYRSPTPLPPVPAPTSHFVAIKGVSLANCDTWYIQGTVWSNGEGSGFVPGTRVRLWIDGGGSQDAIAGATGKNSAGYYEFVFPKHTAGSGRIGIVDNAGNLLTPGWYALALTQSCTGGGAVNEVIVDFSKQ